ncbi:MAG: hypothetical protein AVO38_15870 [delta proteobacterium ML8_D]|jgi:hypothetical protein|nr:MAG: hypothetical protein AVO38_15870 [delta proteobacterium ML8_D]
MSSFTYLLDNDILSDLVRHPAGRIAQRIEAVGEEGIFYQSCGCRRAALAGYSGKNSKELLYGDAQNFFGELGLGNGRV